MSDQSIQSQSRQREQLWRKIISGQPGSGLSVVAWCAEHGVSAPSFYVWRQRLAQRAKRKPRREQLLPVEIIPSGAGEKASALEIELPSRARVHVRPGGDLELLRQVLAILQQG